jgi:hypothetical protein
MRRVQAILAVLTLAALPLVPLAQASQISGCKHRCACCLRQGMHSVDSGHGMDRKTMYCQRHTDGRECCCGMMSPQNELRVVLAPIPPTLVSSLRALAPPSASLSAVARAALRPAPGFSPDLFEPPRA